MATKYRKTDILPVFPVRPTAEQEQNPPKVFFLFFLRRVHKRQLNMGLHVLEQQAAMSEPFWDDLAMAWSLKVLGKHPHMLLQQLHHASKIYSC